MRSRSRDLLPCAKSVNLNANHQLRVLCCAKMKTMSHQHCCAMIPARFARVLPFSSAVPEASRYLGACWMGSIATAVRRLPHLASACPNYHFGRDSAQMKTFSR